MNGQTRSQLLNSQKLWTGHCKLLSFLFKLTLIVFIKYEFRKYFKLFLFFQADLYDLSITQKPYEYKKEHHNWRKEIENRGDSDNMKRLRNSVFNLFRFGFGEWAVCYCVKCLNLFEKYLYGLHVNSRMVEPGNNQTRMIHIYGPTIRLWSNHICMRVCSGTYQTV